jgi:ATP-dependent Lon protease
VGADFRGDPSSALLEVLDPAQNSTFSDHYLEVPFDLSKVLFITTANWLDPVPAPLRDRMEVLEIPGYTEEEKLKIAQRYLLPRQREEHGLTQKQVKIPIPTFKKLISEYTREAGVRNLEREIATLCRKAGRMIVEGKAKEVTIEPGDLSRHIGAEKFFVDLAERTSDAGVATGLAWTPVGGEILFIEASRMPGKGNLILTGSLGDVMRESAQAALTYVKANSKHLGIEPAEFEKRDIHVHIPGGAVPKDGPSAGVTLAVALASLLSGKKVKPRLAMTGEISLRGKILPIGGLKEKALAARRAGIKTILYPDRNSHDLDEIPGEVRSKIDFVPIKSLGDAFKQALG